jgi:hypothetical protein
MELFVKSCPEEYRPSVCPHCGFEGKLHKHGSYERLLFTLQKEYTVKIFRFKCSACSSTSGLLPLFLVSKRQEGFCVVEDVLLRRSRGASLAGIAKAMTCAGGSYSERTLWRWCKRWDAQLKQWADRLWSYILGRLPHVALPARRLKLKDEWGYLMTTYRQLNSETRLLELLSLAMARG